MKKLRACENGRRHFIVFFGGVFLNLCFSIEGGMVPLLDLRGAMLDRLLESLLEEAFLVLEEAIFLGVWLKLKLL